MKYIKTIFFVAVVILLAASCSDDDSFSNSPNNLLTFSSDTIKMDTVFSKVPTSRVR